MGSDMRFMDPHWNHSRTLVLGYQIPEQYRQRFIKPVPLWRYRNDCCGANVTDPDESPYCPKCGSRVTPGTHHTDGDAALELKGLATVFDLRGGIVVGTAIGSCPYYDQLRTSWDGAHEAENVLRSCEPILERHGIPDLELELHLITTEAR